jgi:DNA-directed RNA polymerase specialized sigma24 family protein
MPVKFRSGSSDGSALNERVASAPPETDGNVYETFTLPLFDYCAGLLGDQVAAAGAVQDSLVAVDARIGKLPDPGQLRVPLYCAARRQCLGQRPGRRPRLAGRSGTTSMDQAAAAVPEADVAHPKVKVPRPVGETLPVVTAALARLPDRDREVLNLVFRHGIEGADLATVLGLSPRRVRSLRSGAGARFGTSAAVAVVLRAGRDGDAGCQVLTGIVSQQDAVSAPLAAKLIRLNRHIESCPGCARVLGDRAFPPDLVSQVPLAAPAGLLRIRIIRTALALASYRSKADSFDQDSPADPAGRRRGAPLTIAVSSLALAVLAVPGFLLYRHEPRSGASPRPLPAMVAPGTRGAASPGPRPSPSPQPSPVPRTAARVPAPAAVPRPAPAPAPPAPAAS